MIARGSVAGPLVLILLGVVFLIHAFSPDFRLGDLLAHYWPYALIVWGVVALLEVCIRFFNNGPIPRNGVSGGAWVLVVFIAMLGSSAFEFQRPNNWFRQVGFDSGMQAFGEEHHYPLNAVARTVGRQPRIVIEDFRGDAKITGGEGDQLTLNGQKNVRSFDMSDADKANAQTSVEILTEGDTVTIRCHQDRHSARSSVTTNLDLSVPKGSSIQATASHGNIDISAIGGAVELTGGNSSDIRLEDVGGNVKLDTRGADSIHCTDIRGDLDLHGRGSDVELEKVAGQVTIGGEYTGTVSLRALSKPVRLDSMRTQLDARRIPGYIRLNRGSLEGKTVVGPVKLTTHSTDITLSDFSEGLDLNVDRGDIELRPEQSAMGNITVRTKSGDIELALPSAAHFALSANTENGEIENEFGDTFKASSEGHGAHLEGSVGSGSAENGPEVKLITQHGSITLKKAGSEGTDGTKATEL